MFIVLGINTVVWLGLKNHPGISAENGPMENFQAACLAISFLLWVTASLLSKNHSEKILLSALALFSLTFLILEVDTRSFDAPLFNKLFNGKIRNAWLGALWLVVGLFFLRSAKITWAGFLYWMKTWSGILMVASGAFWIASGLIDKGLVGQKDFYREELMETYATLLMALSAGLFLANQLFPNDLPPKSANLPSN